MEALTAQRTYAKLVGLSQHTRALTSVSQLLEWDQETYMPPGAIEARAIQHKVLAGVIHKEKTGRPFKEALCSLIDLETGSIIASGLHEQQRRALYWWRHDYLRDKALPIRFVEELSQLSSQAINIWRIARKKSDFTLFAPILERIVDYCRRKADLIGYKDHPYDALVDEFEPEMTTKELMLLFDEMGSAIQSLVKAIRATAPVDDSFLHNSFLEKKLLSFSHLLLETIGYDFSKGRLDLSTHPFSTSMHPTDSRVTTRIGKHGLMNCLSATLHEGGHSLYEMGLPLEGWGTPLGSSVSLGIHESQSRWWETYIGLSRPFWEYFFPLLQDYFPEFNNISLEAFYRAINKVEPSFIRVEADEVTYPLHILLRFTIERQLIEGSIKVSEVPDMWNSLMQELLGITPVNDAQGCLQDIHWSMGAFGYFPTYALGNMYAGQLFKAFTNHHLNWAERLAKGECNFIRDWLHQHIFRYGRQFASHSLIELATKQPCSAGFYIAYLHKKYSAIYPLHYHA